MINYWIAGIYPRNETLIESTRLYDKTLRKQFNKEKTRLLKIQSKNKLNSGSYSKIIWLIFQKYGFIDNEMIRYINEFEETLNDFEKRNIKHFFKYKNNSENFCVCTSVKTSSRLY